jgi:D-alanyl-D-alanine carboxypeptidase
LLSIYITSVRNTHLLDGLSETIPIKSPLIRAAGFDTEELEKISTVPKKAPDLIAPIINSRSGIVIDADNGIPLFEDNDHERLAIASITKLMTILIVLEENNLEDTVTVSKKATETSGTTMFLANGEQILVKNLLYGALINSSNDAALALAEYNAGSIDKFIEKMNDKATQLGLVNTHFATPSGLDTPNNYSSAYDIATLARYVYQKQFIRDAAEQKEMTVTSVDGKYTHKLISTNELLGNKYYKIKGLKTGSTDDAGQCLVSVAENNEGKRIITVLLNSPARFTETKILVDWIFRAYTW